MRINQMNVDLSFSNCPSQGLSHRTTLTFLNFSLGMQTTSKLEKFVAESQIRSTQISQMIDNWIPDDYLVGETAQPSVKLFKAGTKKRPANYNQIAGNKKKEGPAGKREAVTDEPTKMMPKKKRKGDLLSQYLNKSK
jgi:hypothetical protein